MTVEWWKCGQFWCRLNSLDAERLAATEGVYLIWSGKTWVRVGQGVIRDRLRAHQGDPRVQTFPDLRVTWAAVGPQYMDGVERYLANECQPAVGCAFPNVYPIAVNLPQ